MKKFTHNTSNFENILLNFWLHFGELVKNAVVRRTPETVGDNESGTADDGRPSLTMLYSLTTS